MDRGADAAFAGGLPDAGAAIAQSLLGSFPGGGRRGGGGRGGGEDEAASPDAAYAAAAFTPNFPAYPSGHATFGAACFDVLRRVRAELPPTRGNPDGLGGRPFESDELDGRSLDNFRDERRPHRPQRFETIEQMIDLNNDSRVWLGVHWKFDSDEGAASGKAIAAIVHGRALRKA